MPRRSEGQCPRLDNGRPSRRIPSNTQEAGVSLGRCRPLRPHPGRRWPMYLIVTVVVAKGPEPGVARGIAQSHLELLSALTSSYRIGTVSVFAISSCAKASVPFVAV